MDLQEFSQKYSGQQTSQTGDRQPVRWFKIEKGGSAKIIIPRPQDDSSPLGVCNSIYVQGPKGGRTIRTTEQTYQLLLDHGVVPIAKASDGSEYHRRPSVRAIMNILNLDSGQIAVWEMSRAIAERLAHLDRDPDTPGIHDAIIKVSKRVTGPRLQDVKYEVQILGRAELTPDQEASCKELYDVERLSRPHSKEFILRFLGIEDVADAPGDDEPF
jgi:hypothetical protein